MSFVFVPQKQTQSHELLTFASRWRSVPAPVNVADQISTSNELVAFAAGIRDHAQVVTGIVDQLVVAFGDAGRHAALNIWEEKRGSGPG